MLRNVRFWSRWRWQCFGLERAGAWCLFACAGLELEFLQGDGVLAEALTHAQKTGVGGRVFDAESLDAVSVKAGDGVVKLSDAEMENGFVKLAGIGAFQQFKDAFMTSAKIGGDFLMADPILVTAVVPVGEVVDGHLVNAIGPAVPMLIKFMG